MIAAVTIAARPPDLAPGNDAAPAGLAAETLVPDSENALEIIMRDAFQKRSAICPVGGGTSLTYGATATKPTRAVSMTLLNRVLDYPSDDLTVTVQSGITLAELNRCLSAKQQWLPIDAPAPEKATIGGIVATNASGPRRYGRGTIGDYLIGFRAIDGRGEAYSGGGKVVKNAAGYNLSRLIVGSLGTLGVITQATFMVRPLPTHSTLVLCDMPGFEQAECLLNRLGGSQTTPTIIEMLSGPSRPSCPLPPMPDAHGARLAIGFEGSASEVQTMSSLLCDEWKAAGADGLTTVTGAGVASVWNWLSASPALFQINVMPSKLVGVMEQIARKLPTCPLQARAGNGVVHIYWPANGENFDLAALANGTLRPIAAAAAGNLTILAAPEGLELTPAEIWGPPRAGAALMRSIQQRFDPAGILNPGRLCFGGI